MCHERHWPTSRSLLALELPKVSNKNYDYCFLSQVPPKRLPDLKNVSGERRQSVTTGINYHIKIYLEGKPVNCRVMVNDGREP